MFRENVRVDCSGILSVALGPKYGNRGALTCHQVHGTKVTSLVHAKEGMNMARLKASVTIRRPADKVFAYTTEAESWPRWHGTMPDAEQISQGPVGMGTTFRGKNRMMGQTMEWSAKLTEFDPCKSWGKIIKSGAVVVDDKLIFDPAEEGTRFTMVYDVKVGGFLKLLSPMIARSMQKALNEDVIHLKNILESQA